MSIALALRLFLTTVFARAAWHKLSQRQTFQAELSAYRLLAPPFIQPAVYGLTVAEIFCTTGLLFSHIAIITAIALLLIYAAAISINLWRGNRHIDCGCGGWLSPRKTLGWALVLRNLFLAMLASLCLLLPIPGDLFFSHMLLAFLMAFTLWLVYETLEQALSNTRRQQTRSAH